MLKFDKNLSVSANLTKTNGVMGCKINFGGLRFKENSEHKIGNVNVGTNVFDINISNITVDLSGEVNLATIVKAAKGAWKGNIQETLLSVGTKDNPIHDDNMIKCGVVMSGISVTGSQVTCDYKTRWGNKDGDRCDPQIVSIDKTRETNGSIECDTISLDGTIQSVAQGLIELKQTLTEAAIENGETAESPAATEQQTN